MYADNCMDRLRKSRGPWSAYPLYLPWYKAGHYEYETKLLATASTLRLNMPISLTYVSLLFDLVLILILLPKLMSEMRVTWSASYRLTNPYLPRSDMLLSPSQFPIFLSSRLTIIFRGMLVVTTCALDCFNYGRGEG